MKLEYFSDTEFHGYFELISPRLLVLLDLFRFRWGGPVDISPAPGAVGRYVGPDKGSDHNIDKWGEVRAVDVMPRGLATVYDMRRAVELARDCGFTAIGIYPHWRPSAGLHLGVREGRKMGEPAMWGAVRKNGRQTYTTWHEAMIAMSGG